MKHIYFNALVYTGSPALSQAFIVEGDRFTFAGSTSDALAQAQGGDVLHDLHGAFVCAGFIDSHMHLLSFGTTLTRARLNEHTRSLSDLIAHLREFAKAHPERPGGWIIGRGWNHDYFTDVSRMPDRHDLDKVSTEHPVAAVRCCGHSLVVNSKALELLGITADTPAPEGGSIGMENGQPDGRLYDNAMDVVYAAIPEPTKEEAKAMIRAACRRLNAYGVTSCHSDDYTSLPWRTVNEIFREMEADGELTVRVYEQSNFQTVEALREFIEAGNVTGTGTDFFRIGPLKLLGDGSLGARTALLSRPYSDAPDTTGLAVFSEEQLDALISCAHEHGMQIAVHAIGDGCVDYVLNCYERALAAHPRSNHRHGIVHCQITRADQLQRMILNNLHIYAQTIFLDYDSRIVHDRVGDTAQTSYCWKTLADGGLSVSNGSDCPVELPDVMAGIQCAVTRASLHEGAEAYLPEQAFSVAQALDSYTVHSAEGSFEEHVKGRIRSGMLADFVILGENPFEVPAHTLKDIPVLAAYLGGRAVYERG